MDLALATNWSTQSLGHKFALLSSYISHQVLTGINSLEIRSVIARVPISSLPRYLVDGVDGVGPGLVEANLVHRSEVKLGIVEADCDFLSLSIRAAYHS